MPTSEAADMVTNSPRPSPGRFSDQAVAGSPSVSAAKLRSTALEAAVARSTAQRARLSDVPAAAVTRTACLRSVAERLSSGAPRSRVIVAGSTRRALTTVGRPQIVTSSQRSPTTTRSPSPAFSCTTTRLLPSPCSPRDADTTPLHSWRGPLAASLASGAARSATHVPPPSTSTLTRTR
ncbi:MAG: hypothetical protein WKG00_37140 [Polyangiaceae bacterium]